MREKHTVQRSIFEHYAEHEIGLELKSMSGWLDQNMDLLDVHSSPEPLEFLWSQCGVHDCMLDAPMPKIILNGSGIHPLVGQIETAGMTQHVWVYRKRKI